MRGSFMHRALVNWLSHQRITDKNVFDIKQMCFVPWDCEWNLIVAEEVKKRLIPASTEKANDDTAKEFGKRMSSDETQRRLG